MRIQRSLCKLLFFNARTCNRVTCVTVQAQLEVPTDVRPLAREDAVHHHVARRSVTPRAEGAIE
jgi:hypothetical protein